MTLDDKINRALELQRSLVLDDLKRGDYVAVVGQKFDAPESVFGAPQRPQYGGMPCEVLSVSLPFVCVEQCGRVFSIDLRDWVVQRCARQYVRDMRRGSVRGETSPPRGSTRKRRSRIKTELDPRDCPRCGERMPQVLVVEKDGKPVEWRKVCRKCGHEGGAEPLGGKLFDK